MKSGSYAEGFCVVRVLLRNNQIVCEMKNLQNMKRGGKIAIIIVASVLQVLLSEVVSNFSILILTDLVMVREQNAYEKAVGNAPDDLVPFSVLDTSSYPPRKFAETVTVDGSAYSKVDLDGCFWNVDLEQLQECGKVLTVGEFWGYVYNYEPVFFLPDEEGKALFYYIISSRTGSITVCYSGDLDLSFSADETPVDIITPETEKRGVRISDVSSSVREYTREEYNRMNIDYQCPRTEAVDRSNEGYIVYTKKTCRINKSGAPYLRKIPTVAVYYGKICLKMDCGDTVYLAEISDPDLLAEISFYLEP